MGGSGVSSGSRPATFQPCKEPQTQVKGRYRDVTGTSLGGRVSAGSQGGLCGELLRIESALGVRLKL